MQLRPPAHQLAAGGRLRNLLQALELLYDPGDILETAVYRCKTHVCHFVELVELFHH